MTWSWAGEDKGLQGGGYLIGRPLSPTLFKSGGRRSMLQVCHGRANSSTGNRARWSEPDLRDRAVPIARSPCRVDYDDHSAPAAHYGCKRRLAASATKTPGRAPAACG